MHHQKDWCGEKQKQQNKKQNERKTCEKSNTHCVEGKVKRPLRVHPVSNSLPAECQLCSTLTLGIEVDQAWLTCLCIALFWEEQLAHVSTKHQLWEAQLHLLSQAPWKKEIALNSWMRSLSFTRKIWIFNFHLHVHHQLSITNCHVCSGHLWKTANRQCRLRITAWPMQSPCEKPTGLVARGRWGRPLPRSVFKTKYSKQWLSLHKHSINSSIRIQVSFQLQGRKTIWFVGKTWTNYRKDILHRKTKLYWIVFGGSFLVFCLVCCCFCLLFIPHVQLARCFAADFIENSLV